MTSTQESLVDAALESGAREVEKCIEAVNITVAGALLSYGNDYEGQGGKFTALCERAKSVASLVPEKITRTDSTGDRSAHALIERSAQEIAAHVKSICK